MSRQQSGVGDEEASVAPCKRYLYPGGGVEVVPAARDVAGIVRVTPAVSTHSGVIVVFFGCGDSDPAICGGFF